jgi:hypothetical protein
LPSCTKYKMFQLGAMREKSWDCHSMINFNSLDCRKEESVQVLLSNMT